MQQYPVVRAIVLAFAILFHSAVGIAPTSAAVKQHITMHMVPVLAQPIARGDIIGEENVVMLEKRRSPAGIDYITDSAALVGMAAKRPLRAGVPLRVMDIDQPKIIKKGDLVTIAFEARGLSLTIRGKALEDGIQGQSIRVINTQTNRTFEGAAAAAGYVLVSPMVSYPPVAPQTSRLEYSAPTIGLPGQ